MNVNCLLITQNAEVEQVVAEVFAGIDLRLREDATSALDIIGKAHFDGFVVDCDGVESGADLIAGIRDSRANRRSTIFTIVNGRTTVAAATELGSNFVLGKPIEANRLLGYLQSSLHKMESEHRRYFRYQLTLDAELIGRDGNIIPAQIFNVSDGGLALRLLDHADLHGAVTIRFVIPGTKAGAIVAKVAVCWATAPIFGTQFVDMNDDNRSAYDAWLISMTLL
jgi:ActR/RegA family two-component response regulator